MSKEDFERKLGLKKKNKDETLVLTEAQQSQIAAAVVKAMRGQQETEKKAKAADAAKKAIPKAAPKTDGQKNAPQKATEPKDATPKTLSMSERAEKLGQLILSDYSSKWSIKETTEKLEEKLGVKPCVGASIRERLYAVQRTVYKPKQKTAATGPAKKGGVSIEAALSELETRLGVAKKTDAPLLERVGALEAEAGLKGSSEEKSLPERVKNLQEEIG